MNEVEKIYEAWCDTQKDTTDIVRKWCEAEEFLYSTCTASTREQIETFLLDYGKLLERQAFLAGFQKAFLLWATVLKVN